jgi:chromosome segregation ATPase
MNELTQLPDMTLEEATAKHAELKSLHGVMRSMLLEMRDRKGWMALGYESWEAYGKNEWGYGQQYLDRLATASRIESIVTPMGVKEIPERQLRPLTKIPESEIAAIWDEANRKAEEAGKERTAKMVEAAVKEYQAKLADAEAKLAGVQHSLDYEETIDTLNTQIEALEQSHQQKLEALTAKHKKEFKDQQQLLQATQEQRDRMIKESNERIARLEKSLNEARGDDLKQEIKAQIEAEIAAGKNQVMMELEQRINRQKSSLQSLAEKSAELDQQYSLRINCKKTLQKVNELLMAMSIELSRFQDDLAETDQTLTDDEMAKWAQFEDQYSQGSLAVRSIITGFKTVKLSVVSG